MKLLSAGAFYLSLWFVLNIGLTLLNKSLMVFYGFKYEVMLSFIHQSISTFFSYFESQISKNSPKSQLTNSGTTRDEFEKVVTNRIIYLSLLFTLNIIFGNSSLRHCSVAFTQVVRAIIPILTMIFSSLFLSQKFSYQQILSCVVVCIGVAFSCFGEINLTATGLFITVFGCFLSAAKSVSIKQTLSGQYELQSADLLARMSPIAAIEMFVLILVQQENDQIVSPKSRYTVSWIGISGAILSGIIAYFLNLSNFLATHHTSPLTVTIAGCAKQVITIVLSVIIFDKTLTPMNTFGIVITTIGSLWYSLLGLKKKPQPLVEHHQEGGDIGVDPEFVHESKNEEEEDK